MEEINLEKNLVEKTENKKENTLDIFKTLFDNREIETKTELTQQQIILINKKLVLAEILQFKELKHAINNFMVLQVSKDRKGRVEFVDGIKAEYGREERQQKSLFSNFMGGSGGSNQ